MFRCSDAAERLPIAVRELAPELGNPPRPPASGASAARLADDLAEAVWLQREGYVVLAPEDGIGSDSADIAALASGIGALVRAGLPAVCVYACERIWQLGDRLRARIEGMVGRPYVLVDDVWAWTIPPGSGQGWPPHRGTAELELARGAPELLNVWVALTDATAERSCIHVVPLDDDPGYPGALDRLEAPLSSVRAVPVPAGTALAWNANLLHWGGRCSARAAGPRVSCSFSVARPDVLERLGLQTVGELDEAARVELIASQIATYGAGQPDVAGDALKWARATCALRAFGKATGRR